MSDAPIEPQGTLFTEAGERAARGSDAREQIAPAQPPRRPRVEFLAAQLAEWRWPGTTWTKRPERQRQAALDAAAQAIDAMEGAS